MMAGASRARAVGAVSAGVAGLGLVWLLWQAFAESFVVQWNAPRLAPAAALVRGLEIYGTTDHGPFLGWIYGPVFPLVFSSVAWLPDQVSIHAAAWLLNLAIVLVPVWFAARCAGGKAAAGGAVLVGGLLALATAVGRNAMSFIHVDLLCGGFGVLACVVLARGPGGRAAPALAALATVLALGTKQVAVGLVAGLVLWLWMAGRRDDLGRYLGWLVPGGLAAAAGAVLVFGFDPLVFNLWTYHAHNPFPANPVGRLAVPLGWVALELVPVALVWILLRAGRPAVPVNPVADRLERALAWVALAHLPLGLLAAAKAAGGLNSIHTFHYLWCLVVVKLVRGLAMPGGLGRRGWAMLLVAAGLAWGAGWHGMRRDGAPVWPNVQRLREDEALARREPGRVYFPWNPLVTILTEREVRPFDDALLCLERCGLPASRRAVLAGIPSGALVVYPDPVQSTFALNYLQGPRP